MHELKYFTTQNPLGASKDFFSDVCSRLIKYCLEISKD